MKIRNLLGTVLCLTSAASLVACGESEKVNTTYETIEMGVYPKNRVSDEGLYTSLEEAYKAKTLTKNSDGYYEYNGVTYHRALAKTSFDTNGECKFADGTDVKGATVYYYTVEPIVWRVLESNNGLKTLITEQTIAANSYAPADNVYGTSSIRTWLNESFYEKVFTAAEKDKIQVTTVDNSVASTDSPKNRYACDNTEDKVYLLSYAELNSTQYFLSNADRKCTMTDFAVASSCYHYGNNCTYWTRSPYATDSDYAYAIHFNGSFVRLHAANAIYGVRPVIKVSA